MKNQEIGSMSMDDLWSLREQVNSELARKIAAEKARLDQRLRQLSPGARTENVSPARRAYPRVFPKYVNPAQPGETWSGRGKQPRWLAAQLSSGRKLDEFRIQPN
jgi:DNA-binding protein H-NS